MQISGPEVPSFSVIQLRVKRQKPGIGLRKRILIALEI